MAVGLRVFNWGEDLVDVELLIEVPELAVGFG